MWIVTLDYKSGTSASIIDSGYKNVIIVSLDSFQHVYGVEGDILFIGHDFLYFLWDDEHKIELLRKRPGRNFVYCFERIRCVVDEWRIRSIRQLAIVRRFAHGIFCTDEQDARLFGMHWLPQWGSSEFSRGRTSVPNHNRIIFHGQSKFPGYEGRRELLERIADCKLLRDLIVIEDSGRTYTWKDYIDHTLSHKGVLAPLGNFAGFNTRTFETINSGRILVQQVSKETCWHKRLIGCYKNVFFFETFDQLMLMSEEIANALEGYSSDAYDEIHFQHTFFSRIATLMYVISQNETS